MRTLLILLSVVVGFLGVTPGAMAGENGSVVIIIKNHKFEPAVVRVPAGKRIELIVENHDKTPEEFESHDLGREKVIAGNGKAVIRIGPLKKGVYRFVGEFHEATAKGQIVAE